MSEAETCAAIAAQEEHIKRVSACAELAGPHAFRNFGRRRKDAGGTILGTDTWRECLGCGVTETPEDHTSKLAAQS